MDLSELGVLLRPAFRKMISRIPQLRNALICTPDGFNVCSVGVAENLVGRMAALTSSVNSIGDALASDFSWDVPAGGLLDIITMEAQGLQIASITIADTRQPLILMVSARTSLGVILVNIKAAAAEIRELLA